MRQTKRFAVVGSDARQAAAGRALARAGYTVGGVQQLPQADCILLPLPLEQADLPLAQLLGAAKPGALALGRQGNGQCKDHRPGGGGGAGGLLCPPGADCV